MMNKNRIVVHKENAQIEAIRPYTEDNEWLGGPAIIHLPYHEDERGSFMESFNEELFEGLMLPSVFVQSNLSRSRAGVIRGMHFQTQNPQGKLIHCVEGCIQDVCIDLRPTSEYRGQVYDTILRDDDHKLFYVPPGFAHGLLALEDSIVTYLCTTVYDAESEGGINPLSPELEKVWLMPRRPIISQKDMARGTLVDYLAVNH